MELKSININKSYKGIEVVKGVSVSLKKGEIAVSYTHLTLPTTPYV